jgi:hypothetical protein
LARTDHQDKLAAVDGEARDLYVVRRDHAAGLGTATVSARASSSARRSLIVEAA